MNLHDDSIYSGIEDLGLQEDLQGWHSTHAIFEKLISEIKPWDVVEVGSWKGASAIHMMQLMLKTAAEARPPGRMPQLFCVDTWLGSREIWGNKNLAAKNPRRHGYPQVYFQFLHNVKARGLGPYVTPLPMTSKDGALALLYASVKPELIYVDASHDYVDVAMDLTLYWRLLRPRGVMFGDDYAAFPGVSAAVDEFAERYRLPLEVVDDNFWILRKP